MSLIHLGLDDARAAVVMLRDRVVDTTAAKASITAHVLSSGGGESCVICGRHTAYRVRCGLCRDARVSALLLRVMDVIRYYPAGETTRWEVDVAMVVHDVVQLDALVSRHGYADDDD